MEEYMEEDEDNKIVFRLGFCCECGNSDADRFLLSEPEGGNLSVVLLCLICESKYDVSLDSKKLIIGE